MSGNNPIKKPHIIGAPQGPTIQQQKEMIQQDLIRLKQMEAEIIRRQNVERRRQVEFCFEIVGRGAFSSIAELVAAANELLQSIDNMAAPQDAVEVDKNGEG